MIPGERSWTPLKPKIATASVVNPSIRNLVEPPGARKLKDDENTCNDAKGCQKSRKQPSPVAGLKPNLQSQL